jgi:SAM-dependent methyltransferase
VSLARLESFLQRLQGDVYPEPPSSLHDEITRRMFADLMTRGLVPAGGRALDVGCGRGLALDLFREAGLLGVGIGVGPDVAHCRSRGLDVTDMDFAELDFADETFDLVWCRHALEHSPFPYFLLAEMRRILRPGGVLYAEVPAPDTACRHEANPNHYSVLGKRMWLELMARAGFSAVDGKDLRLTTAAGPDLYWAFIQRRPAD